MWIKICGNTTLEDALFAAECGANAVGFVFAPSPRRVEADQVRKITEQLPAKLEKYGVFVDAGFDEIVSTVTASGLTGVQIHRTSDTLLPSRLRRHFAGRVGVLPVLHRQDEDFEQQLSRRQKTRCWWTPGRRKPWEAPAPATTGSKRKASFFAQHPISG